MRKKSNLGKAVRIKWIDICEQSEWTKPEKLEPERCESYGVLYESPDGYYRLITSRTSDGAVSGLAIPKGCVEHIEVLED